VLLAAILIAGGLFVRGIVQSSLRSAETVRTAHIASLVVLDSQLDEETAIRGYAFTRNAVFLQPYNDARIKLPTEFDDLEKNLATVGVPGTMAALADARNTNAQWVETIATPVMEGHPRGIQLQGKRDIDRFRDDINKIDAALSVREATIDADATGAVTRILWLVLGAVLVIVLLSIVFLAYQRRLSRDVERAEERSEAERRRAVESDAAYRAEKRIADALQAALANAPLPLVDALRFSAVYVPAEEEAKVGGDWYDAVELGEGRVLFVVGDVAGHGIDAAVTMSRARQALLSAALGDPDPGRVLARANANLCKQISPMVTVVAGYADARTFTFTFASAGHPPPVLLEPGHKARLLACGSLPLGVLESTSYRTERVQSVPGGALILYTDGVVEHSHDVLSGEAMLLEVATRIGVEDGNPASAIRDAIFGDRAATDDVAILTIAFDDELASGLAISAESAHGTTSRPAFPAGRRTSPGRGTRGPRSWFRGLSGPERFAS
jgi:serine phosphatase RsbU (regulator of sigma subunit)/CHASE3 domain sensor protein